MKVEYPLEGSCNSVRPAHMGWLQYRLSNTEMNYLWKCIENKKDDMKHTLAGNISNSYALIDEKDWFFRNTLLSVIDVYAKEFYNLASDIPTSQFHPLYLNAFWVNYQNQNEFNPLHNHTGIYSFVIWMKIPTEYSEQKKNPIARSNADSVSNFSFEFVNMLGKPEYYSYEMGSDCEGMMVFFPAQLRHQVYPFYNCDETRISISGNIALNTDKPFSEPHKLGLKAKQPKGFGK